MPRKVCDPQRELPTPQHSVCGACAVADAPPTRVLEPLSSRGIRSVRSSIRGQRWPAVLPVLPLTSLGCVHMCVCVCTCP